MNMPQPITNVKTLPAAEMFGALHEEPGVYHEYVSGYDFKSRRYFYERKDSSGGHHRRYFESRNMACLHAVREAMGGNWYVVEDSLEYQVEPQRDRTTGAMNQGVAMTICPFCDDGIRLVDGVPDNRGCIHFACADGEPAFYVGKGERS